MKKVRILIVLLGICLLFFGLYPKKEAKKMSSDKKAYIQNALSILTDQERQSLEKVFERLFFFDQCAYPLFGSKPMSIGSLPPINEAKTGWEAWRKITASFNSERYVIRETSFNGHKIVLVANLDEVEKTYHANTDVFNKTFQSRMNWEDLKQCLQEETPLFQELMHNDLCLGILLGYGKRNAELYASNQKKTENKFILQPFSKLHPIFYYFSPIMPVYFACDPESEETKTLKKRYDSERAEIISMAKKDKLLIQMLVQLRK